MMIRPWCEPGAWYHRETLQVFLLFSFLSIYAKMLIKYLIRPAGKSLTGGEKSTDTARCAWIAKTCVSSLSPLQPVPDRFFAGQHPHLLAGFLLPGACPGYPEC
jgi:hypothetical protein